MAEKKYDIYAVGTGKHLGWTQDSPFGPVYDENSGECTGDLIVHNPGSTQLIAVSQDKSERKVNALPRNA